MDRCHCEEYKEAVSKLRFYTVGTFRPGAIDDYDRSNYMVRWQKNTIGLSDMSFERPKVWRISPPTFTATLSPTARRIEQMWCPHMRNPRKL